VYTYRRILAQVLDQAVDDGLIVSNPAKKAKAPSVRPSRQMFLTAAELQQHVIRAKFHPGDKTRTGAISLHAKTSRLLRASAHKKEDYANDEAGD